MCGLGAVSLHYYYYYYKQHTTKHVTAMQANSDNQTAATIFV